MSEAYDSGERAVRDHGLPGPLGDETDAALLVLPQSASSPIDAERMLGTVAQLKKETLTTEGSADATAPRPASTDRRPENIHS
jgi:hypothetical protein